MGNAITGVFQTVRNGAVALGVFALTLSAVLAGPVEDGDAAYKRAEYEQAIKFWTIAAESGNADAQNKLGFMYHEGIGVPRSYKAALKYWRDAAEAGHAEAQTNLGTMYDLGKGVQRSDKLALFWFIKAARQGYDKALYNMARKYDNGEGVTADEVTALMWYILAAEGGEPTFIATRNKFAQYLSPEKRNRARLMAREWFAANRRR